MPAHKCSRRASDVSTFIGTDLAYFAAEHTAHNTAEFSTFGPANYPAFDAAFHQTLAQSHTDPLHTAVPSAVDPTFRCAD